MNGFVKLLGAALMLVFAQVAHAQGANWVVSEAAGKVVVHDASGDHPAKRGTVVPVGGTLTTGAASRAVMVRGKDFATVSANSRVRIPTAQQTQGGRFAVIQEWGNVVFQIEKLPQPHFGVRTPYLAAVVKGTTFSITVTADGASLQVLEGAVQTSTLDDGASEIIRPGILATVSASDRYRLSVQGQDSHNVDSPQRGQAPAPGAPPPEQAVPNPADTAGSGQSSEVIAETIAARPADLGKATDGLVGGTTQVASADVALVRANGNSSGNAQGSDAGKGSGNNANGNGSGSGNGSSQGASDDGASSGSGNGNGNGSGSGSGSGDGSDNAKDSGGGSANGSDKGTGNGSGSGNGDGAGGNGNGSGGTDTGSGNGNGGTGNGNGNGGTDTGNGNGGTGNGNGNGNGNGGTDTGNGNGGTGNGNGNGNGGTDTGNGNGGTGNGNGNGNGGTDTGNGNGGTGNGNGNGNGHGTKP
ncbi:FecR family protein [Sphingomonas sp. LB-2]|uniref:FecR family protein n=1 Tax=Sphingomonas caeni TaxID=2984949 RepID=UPI00222EF3B0|nr:FecR family protein [Sphingomonas caeni]MCW3848860.1 FecR family protein [Sphingomonas caeni]